MFDILTKSILNDLLTKWISFSDVGRLDSAVCEPVKRKQFLDLLPTESFGKRTTLMSRYSGNPTFLTWVAKRSVKLRLNEQVFDDVIVGNLELLRRVLTTIGPSLKRVDQSKDSRLGTEYVDKFILELSLRCTNLQECEFLTFSDAPLTALLARNPHMRSVKLGKCASNKESDMLLTVSSLCPNIDNIDMNFSAPTGSFKCFMDSIPVNLTRLCLLSQDFSHTSLLNLLSQCHQLTELRIAQYVGLPDPSVKLVHPCLQLFRFHSQDIATIAPVLSTIMPNLVTLIAVALTRHSNEYDTSANVTLVLNSFRYLRQLIMDQPEGESKLGTFSALSTAPGMVDPVPANTKRKKTQLPKAGIFLEELFSRNVSEVAKTMKLPALRSVGCEQLYQFSAPSAELKRVVVTGWLYQSDVNIKKLSNLEEIELEIARGVGDEGMRHIARQNPHLRVLRVTQKPSSSDSYYTVISAAGLWNILQHCPLLHTVVYTVQRYDKSVGKTDYLLHRMCLKFYPNIKHFEYSV